MPAFMVKSKNGEHAVYVNKKDKARVLDYHACYPWHIIWRAGKITGVASSVTYGRGTKQVKLTEFIMDGVLKCEGVKYRDGNPLNNRRENLVLYQVYNTVAIEHVTPKQKRSAVCRQCKNSNICQRVATSKKQIRG